ncbi:MAG: hypothetical protein WC076_01685 [Terrimicrobiaceae bacterium]|nr:hypothetical protein [Terrimicrobiaceae bacterium]
MKYQAAFLSLTLTCHFTCSAGVPLAETRGRPQAITFTVENKSAIPAVLRPSLAEISSMRKWPASSWKLGQDLILAPGETRQVRPEPATAVSLNPDRVKARGFDQPVYPLTCGLDLLGTKKGQSCDLLLSDYAVEYGHAANGRTGKILLPENCPAGKPAALEIAAAGIRADDVLDLEFRRNDRTMWRARLDEQQKTLLAAGGTVRLTTEIPGFLPGGKYTAGLAANGCRLEGTEAGTQIVNSSSELPRAEVRPLKGRQAIFVDGKPRPWIGHANDSLEPGDISTFARAGTNFIVETSTGASTVMMDEPVWNGFGEPDFSSLDQRVAMILAQRPDALLVIRPNLTMPPPVGAAEPGRNHPPPRHRGHGGGRRGSLAPAARLRVGKMAGRPGRASPQARPARQIAAVGVAGLRLLALRASA